MPYLPSDTDMDRAFKCPTCRVFSTQRATPLHSVKFGGLEPAKLDNKRLHFLDCDNCGARILFADRQIIYPEPPTEAADPNEDLSIEIQNDYREAVATLAKSSRGSCALLRLCLMNLMKQLGLTGDLNQDIGKLVQRGLDTDIQKSCDSVRVTGNKMVHPGNLSSDDTVETARTLFELVNFIADQMLTQPKKRAAFYEKNVPESAKSQIKRRDNKSEP